MTATFTPSDRAVALTLRTYARPLDDAGTVLESWDQVIQRSTYDHHLRLWEEAGGSPDLKELEELRALGLSRKGLVSGRTLWLGGTEYAYKKSASQYNCSALEISTVYDVVDATWLLLNGCGVGFKARVGTLHGYLCPIPVVQVVPSGRGMQEKGRPTNLETLPEDSNGNTWTIQIGDSAEAWAKAVGKLFNQQKSCVKKLVLDFSQVRGAGGRLKGYGWICNGYKPFAEALVAIHHILNAKAGELLDDIDIGDVLNHIGQILSSRRAAEIWLMDASNPRLNEFAVAKKEYWVNNPQRRQSNNTVQYWSKPTRDKILELIYAADECGGDPAIMNAEGAQRRAPWMQVVNPCARGDTLIPVWGEGLVRIDELEGRDDVRVRDGNGEWVLAKARKTGEDAELVQVELSDGSRYRVTPNHRFVLNDGSFVEAASLVEGDVLKPSDITDCFGTIHNPQEAYLDAWMIADGTWHNSKNNSKLYLYAPKYDHAASLEAVGLSFGAPDKYKRRTALLPQRPLPDKTRIPSYVMQGDEETVLAFVRGYLESDGHVGKVKTGDLVQVACVHRDFLQQFQTLLRLFGVRSKIAVNHKAGSRLLPDGKGGKKAYECREVWRLTVSNSYRLLKKVFPDRDTEYRAVKHRDIKVVKVEPLEERCDVYCLGVESTSSFDLGTVHSGNCCEIMLPSHGFCNLVSVAPPMFRRNFAELERAIYVMARANYRQTCVNLHDGVLQPCWHQTNESLRLCGVSLTGLIQSEWLTDYQITRLRNAAVYGAYSMADELGMPRPKAVTTEKPEGSRTKVAGTLEVGELGEGIHRPLGRYIFNWTNFSVHDPLVPILDDAGYRIIPNPQDHNNVLVCWPLDYKGIKFDKVDGKEVNLEPAIAQLERYRRWNSLWADHNVSCTISYSPEEIPEVAEWIHRRWDDDFVAVSLLRRTDPTKTAADLGHPYLPQEVVTEGQYNDYKRRLKRPEFEKVTGLFDLDTEECKGGVCPVK